MVVTVEKWCNDDGVSVKSSTCSLGATLCGLEDDKTDVICYEFFVSTSLVAIYKIKLYLEMILIHENSCLKIKKSKTQENIFNNVSVFITVYSLYSCAVFIDVFKLFPSDFLGGTFLHQGYPKIFEFKIFSVYCPSVHREG